ncbi:hypothetical protein N0V84_006128 [Fusarium piperis]|uniref:Fucose-specific lectin n=1 Tax=Fusarium piperis TaxID=1435070 RepID=A0A9W8WCH7_9HYPO|nr:hypothetical protein N0V84_006128 [Fusarium piperis]
MPVTLPEDVVAIDTGSKSLLFYVTADGNSHNRLSYLESPDDSGTGDYRTKKILTALDKNDDAQDIIVSSKNKQVAAVTWNGSEIRVYYVADRTEHLREVCRGPDGQWRIGSLGYSDGNKVVVRANTSISASVHTYGGGNYNLRVFAAEEGQINDDDLPQISVYKFVHDETNKKARWAGQYITNATKKY